MDLSLEERQKIVALYKDLRVSDVRDGMDTLLLHNIGSMSPSIRPLWPTRAVGFAKTLRYVPWQGTVPALKPEEYWEWVAWYYANVCTDPHGSTIVPGDFLVIDQGATDVGVMGSANSLAYKHLGVTGIVTNGGVKDSEELVREKVPCWSASLAHKMVQGRLQFEGMHIPVNVGGVTVQPGDVVVADWDGVVVVPIEHARDVARYGAEEHERDKVLRGKLYKALSMQPDETVTYPKE
jgi:regulator of RNase E activity RraA